MQQTKIRQIKCGTIKKSFVDEQFFVSLSASFKFFSVPFDSIQSLNLIAFCYSCGRRADQIGRKTLNEKLCS